jgi:predicted nucleotidyltransferase component of viral defense system
MIPHAFITEWSLQVPWQTNEQVEQDLVICRALLQIFSDPWLAGSLAFRGGTALHKLYLQPQLRYSEDIDLVQLRAEPIKETIQRLQAALSFLGESAVIPRRDGIRIVFRFDSEFPPSIRLRLKVEANTREHFSVLGYEKFDFTVNSSWIKETMLSPNGQLTTYKPEELLGTKLRALYQRRKGRDLFDLYIALTKKPELDIESLLYCYKEYMRYSVGKESTQREFMLNMDAKIRDPEFLGDTTGLLRPNIIYNALVAYELVKNELIEHI